MAGMQISDEELQLYFNYLMKNNGVLAVQDFSALDLDEELNQLSAEALALEIA